MAKLGRKGGPLKAARTEIEWLRTLARGNNRQIKIKKNQVKYFTPRLSGNVFTKAAIECDGQQERI